jgi:F-type H+-transporting ATPase subunit delta
MIVSGSHLKYAKALSRVAARNDAAERVLGDLESLVRIFRDEQIKKLLKKIAYMERSALWELFGKVFGERVDPSVTNLLVMLAGRRKLGMLPKIFEAFSKTFHEEKGIREVTVCTARKLDSEEELSVISKLQDKYDMPVTARFRHNASLIGGLQIYERGYVTDFSIKGHLENLKKTLMEANI